MSKPVDVPSFSIIVETENLSAADLSGLSKCLESIARQEMDVERAQDVIVQDSGNVPPPMLTELRHSFPWISYCKVPNDAGHYEAKMEYLKAIHSDVVVFCDSDCVYRPDWLIHLLLPFADNGSVQIVGGETQMGASSPFALAMVLTHVFSCSTSREQLYRSDGYYANNVAFRREFLKNHPIPVRLPLYRGNCVVHARFLVNCGVTIWKQPKSRAIHALPENLNHFAIRFYRMGGDALEVAKITSGHNRRGAFGLLLSGIGVIYGKLRETARRSRSQWKQRPRRLGHFILAVPVIATGLILFTIGVFVSGLYSAYPIDRGPRA